MTLSYVLMQNLRRNPLRSVLTTVAFALPMAVFVAAISLVVGLIQIGQSAAKELRLAVHHKTTITNSLPEGTRRKIEGLDPQGRRLRAVCGMRWFGGRVPNTQNTLTSLASDVDTFCEVHQDAGLTPDEEQAWLRERTACVVGRIPAEKHGWKVGDRVTLESTVPPYLSLEFRVIKIMTEASRANYFYFRRDYLVESMNQVGIEDSRCNIFWVKCRTPEDLRTLQREIDAEFANTPDETKSEDENAFGANFVQALGDIPSLMQAMAVVVVIVVALVAANTMMMSVRERARELAVFKAIGFHSRRIFAIVIGESMMLALIGALLGVVPTAALLTMFPVRRLGFVPLASLEVSPIAVVGSIGIALLVGLLAGFWPAYQALRLRTVDALRYLA